MFTLIRRFLLLFIVALSSYQPAYAGVPTIPPTSDVPATCDEDFMNTMRDRAWMEAQREVTQNANLVPRPDSVLSMTCFDSFMDDLARRADDHFPGDPHTASSLVFGTLVYDYNKLLVDGDPYGVSGVYSPRYTLFGVLELLVLDQLSDGVTAAGEVIDDAVLGGGACPSKRHYIDRNFPSRMIGGRSKTKSGPPSWTQIGSRLDNDVQRNQNYTCNVMNRVWQRSKCYDFATESNLNYMETYTGNEDHDGFYPLYSNSGKSYHSEAGSGRDFRKLPSECHPPSQYGLPPSISGTDSSGIASSIGSMACFALAHGSSVQLPSDLFSPYFPLSSSPVWNTAYSGATPDPGDPGALEPYTTFLGLFDPASCAAPIKTGYMVMRDGSSYPDAVCVTPGCYYNGSGCVN